MISKFICDFTMTYVMCRRTLMTKATSVRRHFINYYFITFYSQNKD